MRCSSAADVRGCLLAAREAGIPVAIRGGGHGLAGEGTSEGGLVLDLGRLREVRVDPVRRIARVGGGATWGDLDAATQVHGLAVPGSRTSGTGVGGFLLEGGHGWLSPVLGRGGDAVSRADVLMPQGDLVAAGPGEWRAACAAGGAALSFGLHLHPVGPEVLAGVLLYDARRAHEVLALARDAQERTPPTFTTAALLMTAPPSSRVPAELRAAPVAALAVCGWGDMRAGERALATLTQILPPDGGTVRPRPYAEWQRAFDPVFPAGLQHDWRFGSLPALRESAIERLVSRALPLRSPLSVFSLVALETGFLGVAHATWSDPDPDESAHQRAWAAGVRTALDP